MPSLNCPNKLSEAELIQNAKENLGEDQKQLEESVKMLNEWLDKSPHLQNVKRDEDFQKGFLRGCKYSLERTKEKYDFHFTVRGSLPEWFADWDPYQESIQRFLKAGVYLPLPGYDKQGRFVVLMRPGQLDPNTMKIEEGFKVSTMLIELAMRGNTQGSVQGFVLVQDMSGMTKQHALQMNVALIKKAMTVWQDAYPANPKALHFLNLPNVMETFFNLAQSFQKEKMKKRNIVHAKGDLSKLIEDLGEDVLPKEYGGVNGTCEEIRDYWKGEMEKNKDWLIQQTKYKTDEKKRPGKPKLHADIFGIEGSFRKLEID